MKTSLAAFWLMLCTAVSQTAPPPPAPDIRTEQTVYVPFEKLEDVFEKQERGVFLPYREFLELWNKLQLPAKLREKEPPVEGVLASAIYTGKVEGDLATLQAKLHFEALKDGWSQLAIGAGELAIAESKSKALLHFADDGYEMIFPAKGAYDLDAILYGRVTRDSGRSTLHFQLPRTAVSQMELSFAGLNLEFTLSAGSAFSTHENADGTTRLLVYSGSAEAVNIEWRKKAAVTTLTPLVFAESRMETVVMLGAVRTIATFKYSTERARVEALEWFVPEGEQVLSVSGQDLKDWKLEPAPKGQKIHANLHGPTVSTELKITLETPLPAPPQQVRLPEIQALGVERQAGSIVVGSDDELVVEASQLQGLTQQAPGAKLMGGTAEEPKGELAMVGAFRYFRLPYSGVLSVSTAKPRVEVSSQTLLVVEPDALQLRATFNYEVKKSGLFSTLIELPAGFPNAEASGSEVESATVQKTGGKSQLLVKFKDRRTGTFSFTVNAEAARQKPEEVVSVPVFAPQEVERHEARVGLAIHVSLKANTTDRGELHEEDIGALGSLTISKPELTPLTLGFRYRGAVARSAQVQFEVRKPRVSVEVQTLVEVREALIRQSWTLHYNVEFAGVNEFRISMPASVGEDLQIEGVNIKERIKSELKDAAGVATGSVSWRVLLQEKVLGPYALHFSHDVARGEVKPGAVVPVNLEEITATGVFRETGQVAVAKDGNVELTRSEPSALELIDPKELGPELQSEGVFLAYKYAAHPIALRLDVSKNLYLEVPRAVVSHAVLTTVVAEDESQTTEVVYWVRNNSQQFFSVELPSNGTQGARLLSDAFVAGEPQQPSRRPDKNELLIRLPARPDKSEAFPVRFVYEVPSPNPGKRLGWRGKISLQPPKLNDTTVLQTRWALYLPADYRYVKFEGPMRENIEPRGWESFWSGLALFVPQVGPAVAAPSPRDESTPPELPPVKSAGFDTQIQKEGLLVHLRRLSEPAPVVIGFRGRTYAATLEALLCALAFFAGVALLWASRRARFGFFMGAGVGALIISGAVNARAAGAWQAIYGGVVMALGVWIIAGVWQKIRALQRRMAAPKPVLIAVKKAGPINPAPTEKSEPPVA